MQTLNRLSAATAALFAAAAVGDVRGACASDHLDTRTVIEDPRADIGDIYAWTSPDARRLNLVMAIVGHAFSSRLQYVFHVESGQRFGETTATTTITCRFPSARSIECRAGDIDAARGDASLETGLESRNRRFRVFAGLRDDPFFNNVVGSREAYQVAARALRAGAATNAAGCPMFDRETALGVFDKWRHTDGGPGANFLNGWTPASLVVSIDLAAVDSGGPLIAVWAATMNGRRQIDRMGRPLTGNALMAPLADDGVSDELKERYNAARPADWAQFRRPIQQTLGLYDGFDGACGNQVLADASAAPAQRYSALAALLADDRLWVNSASASCTQFFAVELAHLAGHTSLNDDCGGRTPNYDAVDVYRSLLATGGVVGIDDGVARDEKTHSTATFPFLAPP